jgi:hypothetical protein
MVYIGLGSVKCDSVIINIEVINVHFDKQLQKLIFLDRIDLNIQKLQQSVRLILIGPFPINKIPQTPQIPDNKFPIIFCT